MAEAPALPAYNPANDILLTLEGPYKLHPALQKLWEENKGKAPFGRHIPNGRSTTHAGPKPYVGMLIAPVEGRGYSSTVFTIYRRKLNLYVQKTQFGFKICISGIRDISVNILRVFMVMKLQLEFSVQTSRPVGFHC